MKIDRGYGTEYEGAIPAAIHYLISKGNKFEAIKLMFLRNGLPNLINVVATVAIFCFAIYL